MKANSQGDRESRSSIIREIKTPLAFYSLVVLVAEGILGFLASKATGADFTFLVVGMMVTLLALIGAVAFLAHKSPERPGSGPKELEQTPIKHDVFISSPMAAYDEDEKYKRNRTDVLMLVEAFRKECKFKSVVYAGTEIASMKDFEAADISAADDIQALRESKCFVLHYSEKIVSSVLFEAGVALALQKPSLYFVKDRDYLPFLMRQAEQAFHHVKIYEFSTTNDILTLIKNHREKLFSFPANSPR
ncbi:MAG: hypothetical protein LAO21_23115 [Acidobacteriia bacterium]|nr:hypothetical protein [Terriglobia bacterium]